MRAVKQLTALFALATVSGIASLASGAVIFTPTTESGFAGVDPPNAVASYPLDNTSNVLNGLAAAASVGNFAQEGTGGIGKLTDGVVPASHVRTAIAGDTGFNFPDFATGGNTGGTSVTYAFGIPKTITSIQTFGGWQDGGRDQQNYEVQYTTDGTNFVTFASVDFNPPGVPANRPSAARVTLTSTGDSLTNVAALRFNFLGTENGYSGYTELAAYGTDVPEPASLGLLGLGALGLLARRRRA